MAENTRPFEDVCVGMSTLAKLLIQGEVEKEINTSMNSVCSTRSRDPRAGLSHQHWKVSPTSSQPLPSALTLVFERWGLLCEQVSEQLHTGRALQL